MMSDSQKVLIIGGTGFIGYHISLQLVEKGYQVTTFTIDNTPPEYLPTQVTIIRANIYQSSNEQLKEYFTGFNYFIFAAGIDDRAILKRPAFKTFYDINVDGLQKFLEIAKLAGIRKCVVLNSYFSYFDRIWLDMKLAQKHPYIRSRKMQREMCIKVGGSEMPIAIMELPYIVGVTPGKGSLWQKLVEYANSNLPILFYTKGGTAIVAVKNVAQAVVNSLTYITTSQEFQIVDKNMSWIEWLHSLQLTEHKNKRIILLPNWLLKPILSIYKFMHWIKGLEGGLEPISFIDLQSSETFLPIEENKRLLKYGDYSLEQAFEETIDLCLAQRR